VIFVRHARPIVDRAVPPSEWVLAPGAEFSLPYDLPVICSAETKARQTAGLIADACTVDARLSEVERSWSDDFENDVAQYLAGEPLDGWEPQSEALARFTAAVDDHGEATYVAHGTALTLYLASVVPDLDAFAFWTELRMPDAWLIDGTELTRLS
jgi:hypothetical protein